MSSFISFSKLLRSISLLSVPPRSCLQPTLSAVLKVGSLRREAAATEIGLLTPQPFSSLTVIACCTDAIQFVVVFKENE